METACARKKRKGSAQARQGSVLDNQCLDVAAGGQDMSAIRETCHSCHPRHSRHSRHLSLSGTLDRHMRLRHSLCPRPLANLSSSPRLLPCPTHGALCVCVCVSVCVCGERELGRKGGRREGGRVGEEGGSDGGRDGGEEGGRERERKREKERARESTIALSSGPRPLQGGTGGRNRVSAGPTVATQHTDARVHTCII